MDLNSLRASRNTDFSKIATEFEKAANPESAKSFEDTRFWKPERDKAGNASATIRFLPRIEGDELPWVKVFSHGFKGPNGRWYIENSLTTLGKQDPVSELNMKLWNESDSDASPQRKQARAQKRKLSYISNVLVVNDPKHPENNGKVFLFKFGKKIFDKIMDKARPLFEDQEPVNVFDYWEGANFKLRMKTVDGYPNYDSADFDPVSAVASTDEDILVVAQAQHKLSEFTSPANFKSYDELKAKLQSVLTGDPAHTETAYSAAISGAQDRMPVAPPRAIATAQPAQVSAPQVAQGSDDDDVLSYFKSLANE